MITWIKGVLRVTWVLPLKDKYVTFVLCILSNLERKKQVFLSNANTCCLWALIWKALSLCLQFESKFEFDLLMFVQNPS